MDDFEYLSPSPQPQDMSLVELENKMNLINDKISDLCAELDSLKIKEYVWDEETCTTITKRAYRKRELMKQLMEMLNNQLAEEFDAEKARKKKVELEISRLNSDKKYLKKEWEKKQKEANQIVNK
jgi:predicted  nucleic acid-binding Zn-ribbon protein